MKLNPSLRNTLSKSVTLSKVDPADFERLVDFILEYPMVEERHYAVSVETLVPSVANWLMTCGAQWNLKNEDGEIVGVCLNFYFQRWWAAETSIFNALTFILPEYRSRANFDALLDEAEKYAKMEGKEFIFSPVDCNGLDVKKRLMKQKNYTEIGSIMRAP